MEWNRMEWNRMEWNRIEWNGIEWNSDITTIYEASSSTKCEEET